MTPIQKCIVEKKSNLNPIWLMRQAGRYLPEFREIRSKNQDFIKLCLSENLASEITLQPIERFNFDAAIIFSDILMLPYGLNQKVEFEKNFGPKLGNLNLDDLKNIDEVDEAIFDEMTDSNWKGAYFTVQKALPLMESGGSIQLISSGANLKGFPSFSVYSGTKAAVRSLARCLASELAPRGIRVNCLSPGCIETPVWTKVGVPDDQVDSVKDYMIPFIPMARFGEPEEIATTSLFLASDESSYITGANIAADGGLAQV